MDNLSSEQITQLQEAFSLFDKDGTGRLSCTEFGTLIRSLGYNPSEDQLNAIADELSERGIDTIDFSTFLHLINKHMKDTFNKKDILDAFKILDRYGTGFINADELRYILTTQGEKLTNEEVDELFQEVKIDDEGRIVYDEFVKLVISNL
ncbi:calmodulin-like [Centruroides vittatus]|uniref:calmodulin-like n=1 Tax=Centruroides vittatus TaxID=120091 RepID=UPI003510C2CB